LVYIFTSGKERKAELQTPQQVIPVTIPAAAPVKIPDGNSECPWCKSDIRADALVCPHCRREVSSVAHGNNSIGLVIIILLVIMASFWLIVGFLQIASGSLLAELGEGYRLTPFLCGGWNIIVSVINLALIADVMKRKKSVVRNLMFLGIVGVIWGTIQLIDGAWLQACAIPMYIVLAVLANINKEYFSVE
jgi:hypothetical protein